MQIKIKNKGILDFHLEQTDEKKWELVTNDRSVDITLEWSGAAFTISESDKILIDADDQDLSLLLKQLAQQYPLLDRMVLKTKILKKKVRKWSLSIQKKYLLIRK